MVADFKRGGRVDDLALLRQLHLEWQECVLDYETAYSFGRLSLHHIHNKPRSDVRANLVMLCGDGVTGCHGRITANDPITCSLLAQYLLAERPDTIAYLASVLDEETPEDWLRRRLWLPS